MDAKLSKSLTKLKRTDLAVIFDVTETTITNWVKSNCPRNEKDKTFSLVDVIQWRTEKLSKLPVLSDKNSLEIERLRSQIEKLNLEIAEKKLKTITREKFEEIQRNQASELMDFVKSGFMRNSLEMIMKLGLAANMLQKFNEVMAEFMKEMFDAFVLSGIDID